MSDKKWYNINDVMGYDKLFYIIVGARSIGKTYAVKRMVLKKYLKTGEQFIYMKRTEDDIAETTQKWFDDLERNGLFKGYTLDYGGGNFYFYKSELEEDEDFNKEDYICGYYKALTKVVGKKSIPYPYVRTIVYDEFMNEKGVYSIKNEPHHLMEFYYTVARLREPGDEVRMIMLSNAISITNDYFRYFKFRIPQGFTYGFLQKKEIVLHIAESKEFEKAFKENRINGLFEDTPYYDYAVENKFFYDNNNFVGSRPKNLVYSFNIKYDNVVYAVWIRSDRSEYYVDANKVDKKFTPTIAVRKDDHDNGTIFNERISRSFHLKQLATYYDNGLVGFDSIDTKNIIEEIMYKRG